MTSRHARRVSAHLLPLWASLIFVSMGHAGAPKAPAWMVKDSVEASRFIHNLGEHPESVDSLAPGAMTRDHDLAFGYKLREAWINPAGRLGFALKIVYRGNKPISFEANPVTNYPGLRGHYQNVLLPFLKINKEGSASLPYYWNPGAAAEPFPPHSLPGKFDPALSPAIREAMAFYMTPFSGTLYGLRGGQVGQIL